MLRIFPILLKCWTALKKLFKLVNHQVIIVTAQSLFIDQVTQAPVIPARKD